MKETLLSWAIARNAAGMSDQQLSEYVLERTKVVVDPHDIWTWRNGYDYLRDHTVQVTLARTFGYNRYSQFLIPDDHVAMSVMIVAEQMGISSDKLRTLRLKKSVRCKLAEHMRLAIDITGAEASTSGIAVEFLANYIARPHPIEVVKMRLSNYKEN